jgi:hypothetical protein
MTLHREIVAQRRQEDQLELPNLDIPVFEY